MADNKIRPDESSNGMGVLPELIKALQLISGELAKLNFDFSRSRPEIAVITRNTTPTLQYTVRLHVPLDGSVTGYLSPNRGGSSVNGVESSSSSLSAATTER